MSWRVMVQRNNLYEFATGGTSPVRCLILLLGLSIYLLLSACDSHRLQQTAFSSGAKPVLSASPNPIPAGDPDQSLGSTTITWDTGNGTIGDLYVKVNREPEKFMARGPSGTQEIHWIQFDSFYEFRLYVKKRSKLLAKLGVTRDN